MEENLWENGIKNKQDLLDLYNALNGSTYTDPGELEVVTLEDVIFMKMKNDLSFIIGSSLNLYEHQSTWNPNMPLRGLLYLSDSFSAGRGTGCLECTCEVLNINRGYNRALMEKCHRLWEYSELNAEIGENLKNGLDREAAVMTAIDTCIEKGILADILIKQKAEVLHMLLTHYDEKKHLKTIYKEGREDMLKELIQTKLSKGKTIAEIATELETEAAAIERLTKNL